MTQIAKTNSPVMTVYATDANMCIAAKDNVTTGGLTMRNIKQKIRANAESICKTCIHSNVCWVIDNQPCVECSQYEPVKRGRWEHNSDFPDRFICYGCGAMFDMWKHEQRLFNYCPNCGARMDLEEQK